MSDFADTDPVEGLRAILRAFDGQAGTIASLKRENAIQKQQIDLACNLLAPIYFKFNTHPLTARQRDEIAEYLIHNKDGFLP